MITIRSRHNMSASRLHFLDYPSVSAMSFTARTLGDAQTTITSLAAGVGGATSSRLGDVVISYFPANSDPGFGGLGLEFCARAVVSAAVFSGLSYGMPETSGNIFFSILYFACDRGLMQTAQALCFKAVGSANAAIMKSPVGLVPGAGMRYSPTPVPGAPVSSPHYSPGPVMSSSPHYGTGPVFSGPAHAVPGMGHEDPYGPGPVISHSGGGSTIPGMGAPGGSYGTGPVFGGGSSSIPGMGGPTHYAPGPIIGRRFGTTGGCSSGIC